MEVIIEVLETVISNIGNIFDESKKIYNILGIITLPIVFVLTPIIFFIGYIINGRDVHISDISDWWANKMENIDNIINKLEP